MKLPLALLAAILLTGPALAQAPSNPPGTVVGRALDQALGTNNTGTNPGAGGRDGTPGNPPSTVTGRATDRVTGEPTRPDGTPGNPPGTAAGRAMDRTLGTNTTGTNPSGTDITGTPRH